MHSSSWQAVAAAQAGMICRRQLSEAGVDRWTVRNQVRAGRWRERSSMVLSTFTGELGREQRMWLGVLHAGPRALLGDLTAAEVHGLARWHRDDVTVLLSQELDHVEPVDGVTYRRTRRPLQTMRSQRTLPTMTLEPAVLHFAAYQPSERTAQGVLAAVVQQRLTSPGELLRWIDLMKPLRKAPLMRACLGDIDAGAGSLAEIDLGRLCRGAGLAPPHRQVRRRGADGRLRYTDVEWLLGDGRTLVLEVDGAFHLEVEHWEDDIARERSLVSPDRIVVRCTAREVRDEPGRVAADLIRLGVPPRAPHRAA